MSQAGPGGPWLAVAGWCGAGRVPLARQSWDDSGDWVAGMAGLAVQARAGLGSGGARGGSDRVRRQK